MMPEKNEKQALQPFGRFMGWLLLVACLAGIPAILVFTAASRFYQVSEDELAFKLKMHMQQATNEAMRNTSQEEFWCRHLHQKFVEFMETNASAAVVIEWLHDQRRLFPEEIDFIFWDGNGNQLTKTFTSDFSEAEWREVFWTLSDFGPYLMNVPYRNPQRSNIETARRVLGPQTLGAMFSSVTDPRAYALAWVDSSQLRPPVGAYFIGCGGAVVLLDHRHFSKFSGLKHSIRALASDTGMPFGVIDSSGDTAVIWRTDGLDTTDDLRQAFSECEKRSLNYYELAEQHLGYQYLSPGLRLFVVVPRLYTWSGIVWRSMLAAFACLVLLWPFFRYTWLTMIRQQPGSASIRNKLAFLFLFAAGIPLLAMAIISQEHYLHKRHTLMVAAHQNSVELLLSFDRRYSSFLKDVGLDLDRFFAGWSLEARSTELDDRLTKMVASYLLKFETENFFVIASESRVLAARDGFVVYSGSMEDIKINHENSRLKKSLSKYAVADIQTANLVGKKVMSDLNRVEIPGQILSKIELVVESLLQRTFIEITHSIIDNIGSINQWGFGYLKDLTYFRFLSVAGHEVTDYLTMVFWKPHVIQRAFLRRALPLANRNSDGFKLLSFDRLKARFVDESPGYDNALVEFARRAGQKPTEEIEIVRLNGEDYLAVGFSGRYLEFYQLIGLYPMRNIDRVISGQKTDLLLFGLFSILLAAGLAQLLARAFVEPLGVLREGALAIENRNFSHRIRNAGRDEFGEVAGIFNHIMVGFEELEVARIVQESLFPKPDFEMNRFRLFGRSVSMGELGGDYLDFFKVDETGFVVLMGDVAGHGVGAALIMAMAKAGILSSGEQLASPKIILNGLHQMVLASKSSRQKKVMTFQYLYMNSVTGAGLYANAGACSPLVYRRSAGIVEELKLTGGALGAFKKAVFNEMPVLLASGDAVIFYTDGIVESRDRSGREIGYEGLQQMLVESYDADPAVYYQNIFARYAKHIGGQEAQDDLTFIIMTCL